MDAGTVARRAWANRLGTSPDVFEHDGLVMLARPWDSVVVVELGRGCVVAGPGTVIDGPAHVDRRVMGDADSLAALLGGPPTARAIGTADLWFTGIPVGQTSATPPRRPVPILPPCVPMLPCRVRRERSGGVVAAVGESHCRGSSGCLCRLRTLGAHAGPRGSAERTAASRPGPRLSCSRTRRRRSSRRRADCAVALPGGQRCVCPAGATTRLHLGGSSDSRATEASRAARSRVKPGMTGAFGRLVSTSSTNGD